MTAGGGGKSAAGRALYEDTRWLRSTNNANNFRIVTASGTGNWANTQELHAISPGSSRWQSK